MDKYTKLQKIGQGSFGCAYLCVKKHEPQGRKCVIKEIRMDPRDQQTALREAKLLAALDHPNIIGCRESFLASANVLCIVTEFADGGDLRKQLTERASRRSLYKESELLDLFIQSCLALKHLHDRKIIHRDIKPENIFLTSSHVVKLGDFGVATVLSHTLACAQTLTGTPYYTSPEICLGKKYNSKTDIWSLGCVLYELATFSHAFNGRSQRQLFENIINGAFIPISSTTGAYSPRLVALVSEMLQKNPRDRPSVNQLIRKPIIMEKIQSFLSQRSIADELNHTVLHGQHIFQRQPQAAVAAGAAAPRKNQDISPVKKKAPSPVVHNRPQLEIIRRAEAALNKPAASPVVRAVQYEATRSRKKPEAAGVRGVPAAAGVMARRNSLKSSNSKKKLVKKVGAAEPSPVVYKQQQIMPPPAPVPQPKVRSQAAKSPSPSPALSEMQQRLLQRKKEVIARAKEDAEKRKAHHRSPVAVAAAKPAVPRQSQSPVKQKPTPVKAKDAAATPQVSDLISVFMAQWQAQREQILNNIASPPPPPPISGVPVKKPAAETKPAVMMPPPPPPVHIAAAASPAPLLATGVVVKRAKKPVSASAMAAAKQREAMRRDIMEKKKAAAKKRPSVASDASPSPLDDPVILVQNLPDYKPAAKAAKPVAHVVAPPPAPTRAVVSAPEPTEETVEEEEEEEVEEEEEEEDVPTPDSTIAEKANLEFQRMLLQLQSVVDEPTEAEEEEEEDDEGEEARVAPSSTMEEKDEELRTSTLLAPPSYDGTEKPNAGKASVLTKSTLEDPAFKAALRARLRGDHDPAATELEAAPHAETLAWLHRYIKEVI